MHSLRKRNKGFTLIELMIVVAIIGILAAIAIPNFLRFQLKAKSSEGKVNVAAIRTAEVAYHSEFAVFVGATASPAAVPATKVAFVDAQLATAGAGFNVIGWARSARQTAAWPVLSGESGLVKALADAAFVVAVLPLTAETKGLLSAALFSRMCRGAYLINVGRGEHLVEADLLAAIDSKHLSGAALDAFTIEPLPLESPLWAHPDIFITPHVASLSNPATGAMAIAKEIEAFRMNGVLEYEVDCRRQY